MQNFVCTLQHCLLIIYILFYNSIFLRSIRRIPVSSPREMLFVQQAHSSLLWIVCLMTAQEVVTPWHKGPSCPCGELCETELLLVNTMHKEPGPEKLSRHGDAACTWVACLNVCALFGCMSPFVFLCVCHGLLVIDRDVSISCGPSWQIIHP